jgi:uncharacterized protein (DUF302 family)
LGTAEQIHLGEGRALDITFDDAINRVKAAFQAQGFGVVTELDVRKTLHDKIGEEMEPYTILGMCNPNLASRALQAQHEIGLLLPCNVIVHECGGKVHVAAQDPVSLLALAEEPDLMPVAEDAKARIQKAMKLI